MNLKKAVPRDIAELRKQMLILGIGYKELSLWTGYTEGTLKVFFTVPGKMSDRAKQKISKALKDAKKTG